MWPSNLNNIAFDIPSLRFGEVVRFGCMGKDAEAAGALAWHDATCRTSVQEDVAQGLSSICANV